MEWQHAFIISSVWLAGSIASDTYVSKVACLCFALVWLACYIWLRWVP